MIAMAVAAPSPMAGFGRTRAGEDRRAQTDGRHGREHESAEHCHLPSIPPVASSCGEWRKFYDSQAEWPGSASV
jgi:hypothetical protein